jgi:DNA binding domain, excisionase family
MPWCTSAGSVPVCQAEAGGGLTTAQVAELLGLNVRTVMAMAIDGRLEASRLPGSRKYHFFLESVLDTLAQHRVGPTPEPAKPSKSKRRAARGGS